MIEIGGGCRLEEADAALAPYGLAFPTGTNPDTGVAGTNLNFLSFFLLHETIHRRQVLPSLVDGAGLPD